MGEVLPGFVEGEQERIAYLFETWRARKALEQAPEIVAHVRSLIGSGEAGDSGAVDVPSGLEDGKWVQLLGIREESSPLRVTAADAADALYAQLVEWVVYWADGLEGERPASTAVAWRSGRDGETLGFRAGTTVSGAALLTRLQTMWLLLKHDRIVASEYGPQYVRDVTSAIWALRARFPMEDSSRGGEPVVVCQVCGLPELRVSWFHGEDRDLATVRCDYCGDEPAGLDRARREAEVLRWLQQERLLDPSRARVL